MFPVVETMDKNGHEFGAVSDLCINCGCERPGWIFGGRGAKPCAGPKVYLLRQASAARLKAAILMMLEIITLTASREEVIAELLKMSRPNHPELTDKRILEILEQTIPHTLRHGGHI